jgi:alkanesulfonate monooxygenase SsuD/methylene tetrahydromethanopterin reductase-like flavin-dependent oxidoreductase (luciferase family)
MLQLTGTKADGWVPTLGYLGPGDLERGNAAIDTAARAAGREPRDIARHLIFPPTLQVGDLVTLARQTGISTFIIATDDPTALKDFARKVAPEARARVAEARATQKPPANSAAKQNGASPRRWVPDTKGQGHAGSICP